MTTCVLTLSLCCQDTHSIFQGERRFRGMRRVGHNNASRKYDEEYLFVGRCTEERALLRCIKPLGGGMCAPDHTGGATLYFHTCLSPLCLFVNKGVVSATHVPLIACIHPLPKKQKHTHIHIHIQIHTHICRGSAFRYCYPCSFVLHVLLLSSLGVHLFRTSVLRAPST